MKLIGQKDHERTPFDELLIELLMGMQTGHPAMKAARAATMSEIIVKAMTKRGMSVILSQDLIAIEGPQLAFTEAQLKDAGQTKQDMINTALAEFGAHVGAMMAENGLALLTEAEGKLDGEPATSITMRANLFLPGIGAVMAQRQAVLDAVRATHPGGNA
jgi:cellobiose-specific phosphotransferase system component IIB